MSTSLLHGGCSIKMTCDSNNWHNNKYKKSLLGTRSASSLTSNLHGRNVEARAAHSERLHLEAVFAFSIEDLCHDLNIEITKLPRHRTFESISNSNGLQFSRVDKMIEELNELLSFSVKVRWVEEHSSNYPGCRRFNMVDLDQKVANRVCANSKGSDDVLLLENKEEEGNPYEIKIKTGCKNEPRRGERFCRTCMSDFAVPGKSKEDVCFLQSLHPLNRINQRSQIQVKQTLERNPKANWILVKQFGVKYKFFMNEVDLPNSAKVKLQK